MLLTTLLLATLQGTVPPGPLAGTSTMTLGRRAIVQGGDRIALLDPDGEVAWELPWGAVQGIHVFDNGNVMVTRGSQQVVEIEPSRGVEVWSYPAKSALERAESPPRIHAFEPQSDGTVMVVDGSRALFVDRLGRVQHEVQLRVDGAPLPADDEPQRVRVLDGGNLLACHGTTGTLREYDAGSGEAVWTFQLPPVEPAPGVDAGPCFGATRRADGHTLVTTRGGRSVLEVTPVGDVVAALHQDDLAGMQLGWTTTIDVMANGHYLVGNRPAGPREPSLIEFDPLTRRVVGALFPSEAWGRDITSATLYASGPEAALIERARSIHRSALTLDTHKDISTSLASPDVPDDPEQALQARRRNDPTVWGTNQVDFPKMRAGGLDAAFYIVYVGQGDLDEAGYASARAQADAKFDAIERMARRYPQDIEIARSAADVVRIAALGKLVACIGIENGYAMGEDLGAIEEFHRRGARYMSLTHNRHSQLGDSNTPADEPLHGGLSALGRRAIEEMNRVGIMVDISHAGPVTTLQAIAHSKAPVIASHSSVDGVMEHGRNLGDAELDALRENGGVVQCVAFASYVKDDGGRREFLRRTREELGLPAGRGITTGELSDEQREKQRKLRDRMRAFDAELEQASVRHFVDHIDYAVKRIGVDHVAISSDFDGGGGVVGWNDASETFNVTMELVRRGYDDEAIARLWSGNTLRVWHAVEAVAAELADSGR